MFSDLLHTAAMAPLHPFTRCISPSTCIKTQWRTLSALHEHAVILKDLSWDVRKSISAASFVLLLLDDAEICWLHHLKQHLSQPHFQTLSVQKKRKSTEWKMTRSQVQRMLHVRDLKVFSTALWGLSLTQQASDVLMGEKVGKWQQERKKHRQKLQCTSGDAGK